jgi:hypothetical protein
VCIYIDVERDQEKGEKIASTFKLSKEIKKQKEE